MVCQQRGKEINDVHATWVFLVHGLALAVHLKLRDGNGDIVAVGSSARP